ncbi:type II/IV secretion system ATPase subunit [Halomarina ordinaria]|uniref:type II/IV secretion system ATPase subunit n=1 Tax=Halomarina ordinaria TaxID=3033939 RepID=UPI0026F40A29|nr:type II/IV secretion system ATPase subunit [Halomarina sp. PSRA2]
MAIEDALSGRGVGSDERDEEEASDTSSETPVVVGEYTWEDYKHEYFYDEDGEPPRDAEGEAVEFDPAEALGFDPADLPGRLGRGGDAAETLADIVDARTVDVDPDLDEDAFFSTVEGHTTVVNRYDLERAVPLVKKSHFKERDRYWVNEPYAFVVIFHSEKENERKYYVVEPHLTPVERDLKDFLTGKLRTAIKYSDDDVIVKGSDDSRADVITRETTRLLDRYDLFDGDVATLVADASDENDGDGEDEGDGWLAQLKALFGAEDEPVVGSGQLDGIAARPEPALIEEDAPTLTEYQVEKLLYYLRRDFVGYERIDPVKHDINVEDVSCDGYNSPVFVYHTDHEQIISNVFHGETELDDFVVKLAQRSGKGISKRQPQVDCTLPDGSRAQLTLGREVSDHGTNYTIRQFKDVPFTPIDLINWNTFSLEEMAFLWLCIENHKSLIFAGGTASGKTTSLNAVSLFIPSQAKIVSIEDTREVELPQRNWIASKTRPSFSDDGTGDVDHFDLLEAALRQRPEYIVMGEIRGEEGRTLFQVMSTGHTTLTTFHADSVGEVIKRFTTEPINVSKTMFTALDLVSIQTSTRVGGNKVRRNKSLTEINRYDAENDEINVQDVYQWQAETDEFLEMGQSNTVQDIKFDRGWTQETLEEELFQRKLVLAYLVERNLNTYTQVAATLQAFINDPETILTLIANDDLERSLEDLREMESVQIDIDPDKEAMVPRPDPTPEDLESARALLEVGDSLLAEYRGRTIEGLQSAIEPVAATVSVPESAVEPADGRGDGEADVDADGDGDGFEEAPE